jgi:hypothetical protein
VLFQKRDAETRERCRDPTRESTATREREREREREFLARERDTKIKQEILPKTIFSD